MWHAAGQRVRYESTRQVKKELSDLWKIPTPDGHSISEPFRPGGACWSHESLRDCIASSRTLYSTPGRLSNLGFATSCMRQLKIPKIWRRALVVAFLSQKSYWGTQRVSPTLWVTSQEADITRRAPEAACWLRLGCWSNNPANSHPGLGSLNRRVLRACLVPQCSYPPFRPRHQQRLANCDWMPASFTSGQPSYWASSQWSHIDPSTSCHGAWTSAPLSAHPFIECKRTAPQVETPICTRRTTSNQFIRQQQHTCGAVGGLPMECALDGQPYKTPRFQTRHRHPPNDPPKKSLGQAQPPPHRCRTFSLLLLQMRYGLLWGLWVWRRRTNRRPCCSPMSNPSTSPWTVWPNGSGRWNNRMAAQHLPRDLVRPSSGLNNSLKRRRRLHLLPIMTKTFLYRRFQWKKQCIKSAV